MVCVVGTGPARGWELLGGGRPTSQPMGHRKCIHSRDPQRRGPLLSLLLPACKVGCSGQRASPDRHTALLQPPMSLEPPCKALPTAWLQGQWLSDSWPEQGCMCPQKQQKLRCLLRHMLHFMQCHLTGTLVARMQTPPLRGGVSHAPGGKWLPDPIRDSSTAVTGSSPVFVSRAIMSCD